MTLLFNNFKHSDMKGNVEIYNPSARSIKFMMEGRVIGSTLSGPSYRECVRNNDLIPLEEKKVM